MLLDENLPRRLLRLFAPDVQAATVDDLGWKGKKNGELLERTQHEFDVIVTTDRGMPHQQNISRFDLAVVVLETKSNSYENLAALMNDANAALRDARAGTALRVPS